MGMFDRLFGSDPKKDLAKAEEWLERKRPDKALELAKRVLSNEQLADPERARSVLARARALLVENALAMAAEAEESEYFEDAAEWVERALEQVEGEPRTELEKRRLDLLDRARRAEEEPALALGAVSDEEEVEGPPPDAHFDALVDMFDEAVASAYRQQDGAFKMAYVALHAGRAEEAVAALATLDSLVAESPDDPVLRFERGRARLFQGEAVGAREDFEVAWESWGDAYLDRAGSLSVASLWAEALLELEEPAPILERLERAARPENGQADLSLPFARALLAAGALDQAEAFLQRAAARFQNPDFSLLLGQVQASAERRDEAVATLEAAIAPSCATGNCAKPPLHVPTARFLAALHLADDRTDRVEDLLAHVAHRLGGRLGWEDYRLMAELHRRKGDEEAASEAAAEAERIRELVASRPEKGELEVRPQGGQQQRVL
ncbi:MAG: tetratricopeptide repeat protein [Holophagales bacterium]|nr:tetratricopeptide repeat protein [Holophagales bacterium]